MAIALLVVTTFAFAALALALGMERHAKDVLGVVPAPRRRLGLRIAGWVLLAVAMALGMLGWGATVGVVEWTGAMTVATVPLVMLVLPYYSRRYRHRHRRSAAPAIPASGAEFVEFGAARCSLSARLWRGVRVLVLVALPAGIAWAFVNVPPSPVQRDDALAGHVGPWSFVIADVTRKPPEPSALGTAMKAFQVRFCTGCDTQIRSAYLKIRQPRSLRGAGMVFQGPSWNRRADIQIAPTARIEDGLWLTVEGMDGSVHAVEIDLARVSPATARYLSALTGR